MAGSVDGVVARGFWPNELRVNVYDGKGQLVSSACVDALVWRALQNGGMAISEGDRLRVTVEKVPA